MRTQGKLQLVDKTGNIIAARYTTALDKLQPELWRRYPQVRDESDRDNVMEETLCRVIAFEKRNGPAYDLMGLVRHSFHWVVRSLLRRSYYRLRVESMDKARGEMGPLSQSSDLVRRVSMQECLAQLSEREREVVLLMARGFKADQIGAKLGITAANVYQVAYRARAKLLAVTRLTGAPASSVNTGSGLV
jgi:RNA polymerase sigma factor (sigma-70 family)